MVSASRMDSFADSDKVGCKSASLLLTASVWRGGKNYSTGDAMAQENCRFIASSGTWRAT